ncbi:MAG: phosphoglycerate kinase [Myxococcota bacterium]|nr:phosphoglycerate kinase [Myxococcota bacterium]
MSVRRRDRPGLRLVSDLELRSRRVFLRADLNVPLRDGRIADPTRIRASHETLAYLRERGARVVLASHLGRPRGSVLPELSLAPVAEALGVPLLPDSVGPEVERAVESLRDGEAVLLENLRYHPEEEANHPDFAAQLAQLGEIYVNDAFGTCHRAHASTAGIVAHCKQAVAGFLLDREVSTLARLRDTPEPPYVCILGGAKVSDKLSVLEALVRKADLVIVGGAMAYTFLLARGEEVGRSLVETDLAPAAARLMQAGTEFLLPGDHVVADSLDEPGSARTLDRIPEGAVGLDIGPRTRSEIAARLESAATVFWNGPLGLFETPPFDAGTRAVAESLARSSAYTVAAGGDSLAAVAAAGVAEQIDHCSTGGGASLEFVEGRSLPGLVALEGSA